MHTFEYTIRDALGVHAEPAGLLVQQAQKAKSSVTLAVRRGGSVETASLKRLFALMQLNVKAGETISITVDGSDETETAGALEACLRANL